MPARMTTHPNNTYMRRSLNRHLITFRQSGAEPKAWSIPPTRLRARKQSQRLSK